MVARLTSVRTHPSEEHRGGARWPPYRGGVPGLILDFYDHGRHRVVPGRGPDRGDGRLRRDADGDRSSGTCSAAPRWTTSGRRSWRVVRPARVHARDGRPLDPLVPPGRGAALLPGVEELLEAREPAGAALATGRDRARLDPCSSASGSPPTSTPSSPPRRWPGQARPGHLPGRRRTPGPAAGRLHGGGGLAPGCEAALAAGMRVVVCPSAVSAHCDFPPRLSGSTRSKRSAQPLRSLAAEPRMR